MGRGGAARQMRPPAVGRQVHSGSSNLKPPQPRINPAPLPGTLLPGKSALVLFYLMYSCVQYEVLVV